MQNGRAKNRADFCYHTAMRKALFALAVGLLFGAGFVQAQTSITAGDVNALPGSKVVVPITISGGQDVSALQFTLDFDPETQTIADSPPLRGAALVDHAVGVHAHGPCRQELDDARRA